jgi:uncharacterized protein (DUF3820 family)
MKKTTLTKNKEGYGYKYTELAEIHKYLEENGMKYYQTIETNEHNGKDYIMTYRFIDGEWETEAKRGCQVVDATLSGIKNPAQEQGSALTYARRYSLLMAFGLATEDDDAQSLSRPKREKPMTIAEAKEFTLTFGKHNGKKLTEVPQSYLDWLLENEKTDEEIKTAIKLIYADRNVKILTDDEKAEKLTLMGDLNELFIKTGVDRDSMYKHYKVSTDSDMTIEQLKDAISKLKGKEG